MQGGVSIRYARALLELGLEEKIADKLQEELGNLAQMYQDSRDLQVVLTNPSIEVEERKALLRAIGKKMGLSGLMTNFLLLLLDKDRMAALPQIARSFQRLADAEAGRVRAEVTSASAMSTAQVNKMKALLSKMTGKTVVLEQRQDPSLLGGVVTRIGGKVYDGSLRTQLEALRKSVTI